MQSKLTITLLSSALVLGTGLIGWQAWNGQQMHQQLGQLQDQLAALSLQQQGLSTEPSPAGQISTPGSNGAAGSTSPLNTPGVQASPVLPQSGGSQPGEPADPFGMIGGAWDPFAEFDRMQQEMHQQMQQFMSGNGFSGSFFDFDSFGQGGLGFSSSFGLQSQPHIEYEETADAYVVTVEIPEGSEVEVTTELNGQELTISGKVTVEENSQVPGNAFSSRQTQQFAQTFTLPGDVDPLGITSETEDSRVVVNIPRTDTPAITSRSRL